MQVGSVDAGLNTGAISLPRGELEPRHRPALREAALAETAPGRLGPALPSNVVGVLPAPILPRGISCGRQLPRGLRAWAWFLTFPFLLALSSITPSATEDPSATAETPVTAGATAQTRG